MDLTRTERAPRMDGTGRQRCTRCPRRSVPGIAKGHGKCPYHWAVGVWGQRWADTYYLPEEPGDGPPPETAAGAR